MSKRDDIRQPAKDKQKIITWTKWGQELLNGVLRIGAIIPHDAEQLSKQLL